MTNNNEFYTYSVYDNPDSNDFDVLAYDLHGNAHTVASCKLEKVAQRITDYFDNLAVSDERDLFGFEK